jgi:hypothetical protein
MRQGRWEAAMRGFLAFVVPLLCAFYLIDKYKFGGYYADALWTQGSGVGEQYQQQLKNWWYR